MHGFEEPFPVWWTPLPSRAPLLTGWVGGPHALVLAGLGPHAVLGLALDSLASIFARDVADLRTRLRGFHFHDWVADPLAGGGYSYGGVGAIEARAALAEPVAGTLVLAGEAVAQEGRNATVHGALASGRRGRGAAAGRPRPEGRENHPGPSGVATVDSGCSPDPGARMETSVAPRPLVKRHHGLVRLAHWLNAVVLLGMIASGLQIYAAFSHFGPRGAPYPNPFDGKALPALVPARRLARRRAQLALRAGLAVRHHRARLPRLPGLVGRVAVAAVPPARRRARHPDAALLSPPAADPPAAGQAQRPAEGRLHLHRAARRALRAQRVRHLQAGPARPGSRRCSAATSWRATGTSGRCGSSSPSRCCTSRWYSWWTPRRCGR